MSAHLAIPELRQALEEVAALKADVAKLSARIDNFEVRGPSPDLDRVLNLKETAAAIGRSPSTVRHWIADAQLFDRHQLAVLLRKDQTGHWTSSPRLVAQWRQVAFRALQGACR